MDKGFSFIVHTLQGNKKIKDGKGKIMLGDMLNTDVPIFNKEVKLKKSRSKIPAAVSVSIEYENMTKAVLQPPRPVPLAAEDDIPNLLQQPRAVPLESQRTESMANERISF